MYVHRMRLAPFFASLDSHRVPKPVDGQTSGHLVVRADGKDQSRAQQLLNMTRPRDSGCVDDGSVRIDDQGTDTVCLHT